MAKLIQQYGNLQFISLNDQMGPANGAVIISHGGYTPRRNFFQRGSGEQIVPKGLSLFFYTFQDWACVGGDRAVDLARTGKKWDNEQVAEMFASGTTVPNYSLTPAADRGYTEGSLPASDNPNRLDVIMVYRDKAHLSDIFRGIRALRLPYNVLHHYHCRVNKTTFQMNITR